MAKQLNVNLAFTADTSQAQQSINALKTSLQQITNMPSSPGAKMSADMQAAVNSAKELQIQLTNAFNVKTGNLDLNLLNTNLAKSGQNLSVLTTNLLKAGTTGQQAFMNIQRVVANSSVAITKANGVLAQFATTLANTARWQLSSTILHGFMGALNSAFDYAEDLNESLNNIRIVTGYNTDKMAEFAKQANKAAQALNATTVAYTDASLIYFQQGLNDNEVQKRTDITIKMANATGQSVVDVSDQLTAVWNNFAKGADNLEYYADAMTALGAATASSTEEISTGLNKFAAVAETVGLSYEYAAAALATVTATTRQSAEVVGTAFKTLFARIQDLNLGKTLDDGTTLGQYSQALASVGVQVQDTNGNLRQMDEILADMADKWGSLSQAQQVALAQSVAGVRQYTQLIALMENWEFMETNLDTVAASEGTLQEQADIYAESWAAAKKEVKASLESLYNELIPTDFLVNMTNAFGDVVDGMTVFVKGLGGLQGILLAISTIVMHKFQPAIAQGINDAIVKVQGLGDKFRSIGSIISQSVGGIKQTFAIIRDVKSSGVDGLKSGFSKMNADIASSNSQLSSFNKQITTIEKGLSGAGAQTAYFNQNLAKGASASLKIQQATLQQAAAQTDMNSSFGVYLDNMSQVYNIQGVIEANGRKMAAADKARLSAAQEQVIAATEKKLLADQELETLRKQHQLLIAIGDQDMVNTAGYYDTDNFSSYTTNISEDNKQGYNSLFKGLDIAEDFMKANGYAEDLTFTIETANGQLAIQSDKTNGIFTLAQATGEQYSKVLDYNTQIAAILSDQTMTEEEKQRQVNDIVTKMDKEKVISAATVKNYRDAATALTNGDKAGTKLTAQMRQTNSQTKQFALNVGNSDTYLKKIEESVHRVSGAQVKVNQASLQHNQALANTISLLQNVIAKTQSVGGVLSGMFSGLSTIAMGWNSISNAIDTVNDKEADFGQKFTAVAMAGTMGFQALMTAIKGVSTVTNAAAAAQSGLVAANALLTNSNFATALSEELVASKKALGTAASEAEQIAAAKEILMNKLQISDALAEGYAREFVNKAKTQDIALSAKETVTNIGLAASEYAVLWPLLLIVAALGALALIVALVMKSIDNTTPLEKAQKSLDEASKTSEALSENLQKVKDKAQEVRDVFAEYHDLTDDLSKLAEGTNEWRVALGKVQEKMKEIMDMYPELAGSYLSTTGEKAFDFDSVTGLYTMGSWVEQYAMEQMSLEEAEAEIAATLGKIGVARAKIGVEKAQMDKELTNNIWEIPTAYGSYQQQYDVNQGIATGSVNINGTTYQTRTNGYDNSYSGAYITTPDTIYEGYYVSDIVDYQGLLSNLAGTYSYEQGLESIEEWRNYLASDEGQLELSSRMRDYDISLSQQVRDTLNAQFEQELEKQLEIYNKYDLAMAQHVEYIRVQNTQLAQSLLSTREAFGLLNADEKTAATILTEWQLTEATKKWDQAWVNEGGMTGSGNTWGRVWGDSKDALAFRGLLAEAVGVSPTKGDWQGKKDLGYNFEKSSLGQAVVKKYMELEGITGSAAQFQAYDMKFEGTDATGATLGDDYWVSYDEMLTRIMSDYISNVEIDEDAILQQVNDISSGEFGKAIIAGITGNFASLSPEEITEISKNNTFSEEYLQKWADSLNMTVADLKASEMFAEAQLSLENYDIELAKTQALQRDVAAGNNLIAQAASELELDETALQNYAKTIQNLNAEQEISYEQAAQLAIANARMSKGLEKLRDDFEDQVKVLKTYDRESYEVIEVATQVAQVLKDIFGVDVSSDFVLDNLDKIEKAVAGDVEAFKELEILAAKDYVAHLAISDEYKEQLTGALDYLNALPDVQIGMNAVLDQSYTEQLNKMLADGSITAEQLSAAFATVGWSPNIKYRPEKGPETVTDFSGNIQTDGKTVSTLSGTFKSSATVQVPYIDSGDSSGGGSVTSLGQKSYSANLTSKAPDSGGGGGSKKEKKNLDTEKERYYEIEQALDTIKNKLDKIDSAKERAFGKAKSDLIKQEIALLDEEIAKQQELLDEIAKYAETDMANLAAFGFTFDENNNITNYDEIIAQEIARYNATIESGDEAAIAAAEERWRLLQEYLKQFEETMDKWDEETLKEMQKKYERYAKLFEDLTYSIEVKLDIDEDKLKLLDHALAMLEHQSFSTAEAIALMGDKTAAVLSQIKTYSEGITGLLQLHNIDEDTLAGLMDGSISLEELQDEYGFSDEDIAKLREYRDGLLEANEKLAELRNTVQEQVMESFQEWNEEMDRGIAKIEYLGGVLESYKNIVDLVGKSHLGLDDEFMKNMSKAQVSNANDNLRANKAKYDEAVKARENAELELAKARERGDEESVKQWEKTLKQLDEEVQGAHQDMMSSWETTLEAASNAFEEAVERTIATFEEAISGTFGSLEDLQAAFDQQTEITERYVDDYKKIYELSKLNRDIINSIDETDNVKAKRALRDLQEEINELQESNTQMSQYDLDHLRKKYELRLAEIALEEAQNAKTQVRMRKDSEGNYSYVFTADENEVEKARQNYEDKLYEMQELNTAYIREMQANILQSEIELANALRALDRSKFASDADYYAEVQRLTDYYTGQRNYNLDELNKGITNNRETYNEDWRSYSDLTGYKISADEQYLDSFNETVYAQLTGYQSIEDAQARFADATNIMVESLKQAYVDWQAAVKLIMETAGTSVEDFAKDAGDAIGKISEDSSKAAGDVEKTAKDFEEAFKKVLGAVTQWQTDYSTAITAAITANTNMATSCTSLIEMLSGLNGGLDVTTQKFAATAAQIEDAAKRIQDAMSDASSNVGDKSGNQPGNNPNGNLDYDNQGYTEAQVKAAQAYVGATQDGKWGADSKAKAIAKCGSDRIADVFAHKAKHKTGNSGGGGGGGRDIVRVIFDDGRPLHFDTGGYTGSWGSSGRMAMLHQKELVLNAQDTENMLKTVDMVRNIVRVIDLNAGSHSGGLGYIGAAYSGHNAQVIEQEVTIHAEFPNAVNHTEIEMAFDNLINHASQFANRIKK